MARYKTNPGFFYTDKSLHRTWLELSKKYGPVFRVHLGPSQWIILNSIEVVTEALVKKGADFADRPYITSADEFTEGSKDIVFGKYGPTWKFHRKIAGKALRYEIDDEEFVYIINLDNEFLEKFGNGLLEDIVPYLKDICPTRKYREIMAGAKTLTAIIERKYKEHLSTFDKDNIRDFTDSLILARKEAEEDDPELLSQITETHLVHTLLDIFFAGVDTSRMTINWAILHMAGLPDIQAKVQEELDRVVGTSRLPGIRDRINLNYTEAVLHESMRVNSALSVGVPHKTTCDTSVGKYFFIKWSKLL
ncbi:hypothetical protein KUTeg_005212 [Tegillarca granosa]|uniref:Cytochrome P450 n=1 Tax=Tegillarca granosa TaxID=220873 RepID=A0ABQ9FNM5_TEGGR|nr:hypothetical protein KUTeg_005212 [Tegillarca granosa]